MPKPMISANPSPFTSASARGYTSSLDQPPALFDVPKAPNRRLPGAKFPPPVARATVTPPMPKPTMSANPSPFTSASSRGYRSSLDQPPALFDVPKPANARYAGWNGGGGDASS